MPGYWSLQPGSTFPNPRQVVKLSVAGLSAEPSSGRLPVWPRVGSTAEGPGEVFCTENKVHPPGNPQDRAPVGPHS